MFGTKQRSPKKCENCKHPVQFGPYNDIAACPKCGTEFATGYEDEIRRVIEKDWSKKLEYPTFAVSRAIAYCSAIYGMATHNEDFDPMRVERHLKAKYPTVADGATGEPELINSGWEGRGLRLRGLDDNRTGYIVTVVTGDRASKAAGKDFQHIYIVFRGSRSDEGSLANPTKAGFTESGHNVDYAANFTGRQDIPWWGAGRSNSFKIRRGFLELYKSMSTDICLELDKLLATYPKARVIVTGHSLGAALAVTCAHHLQYHRGGKMDAGGPFCFPFCTPRVGNLNFARDFQATVADHDGVMTGEANRVAKFKRGINFVMNNDPVSTKAEYGYKHDRSDDLRGPGTLAANRSFIGKIVYGLTKEADKEIIFYQTPNLFKIGSYAVWNIHQYRVMQEYFMGQALFTT